MGLDSSSFIFEKEEKQVSVIVIIIIGTVDSVWWDSTKHNHKLRVSRGVSVIDTLRGTEE